MSCIYLFICPLQWLWKRTKEVSAFLVVFCFCKKKPDSRDRPGQLFRVRYCPSIHNKCHSGILFVLFSDGVYKLSSLAPSSALGCKGASPAAAPPFGLLHNEKLLINNLPGLVVNCSLKDDKTVTTRGEAGAAHRFGAAGTDLLASIERKLVPAVS